MQQAHEFSTDEQIDRRGTSLNVQRRSHEAGLPLKRHAASDMFADYARRHLAANDDRGTVRPRAQRWQDGFFEEDFGVSPPGLVGLARLATKLEAIQRSGMIRGWSLSRWKNPERSVHGVLFGSERDLDAAWLSIID